MRKTVHQAARATVQLAMGAGLAFVIYIFTTVLLGTAIATIAVVGAWMLPETVLLVRQTAGIKRRMVTRWTGREIPEAYQPIEGRLRERLRTAVRDPGTFTDLRWMVAYYGYGCLLCLALLPLWPVGLLVDSLRYGLLGRKAVVLPLISRLADLDAAWSTALLKPSPKARLTERVARLTETRAGVIAAHQAELRRVEQDLHDGTQARLASLSLRIGLAKRTYARDPEGALKLLQDAQDQAEEALTELRNVVRGIHPPILTDRGLAGAVRALAASGRPDVTVRVDALEHGPRPPAAIEAAAYFVVAEALTNAARHSGSDQAEVRLTRTPGGLAVSVRDEGRGGAGGTSQAFGSGRETSGSGLLGMRRRVAALDGTLLVTSPIGGPTVIDVELPCAW
ncbi:histidine kinase [Streptomyces sp. NPDC050535]|uniref:sensor histidine kinase n=1 Tax=Streptomyces sp. NPDC050535 TaxID=3365626 RepID=UPI00379C69EB